MKAKKRILYPTDFSPAAEPAFEYALEAAKRDEAILILAHVIEPTSPFADDVYMALPGAALEAAETTARRQFDGLLARAKAPMSMHVMCCVAGDRPKKSRVSLKASSRI